jgi:hypothetical protein
MRNYSFKEWFGNNTKQARAEMAQIRERLKQFIPTEEREKLVARYKELLAQGYGDENVDVDLLNMPLDGWNF